MFCCGGSVVVVGVHEVNPSLLDNRLVKVLDKGAEILTHGVEGIRDFQDVLVDGDEAVGRVFGLLFEILVHFGNDVC